MTNIIKHCSTLFPIAFNNQPNFNSLVDPVHLQLILATPLPTNSFRDWVCSGLSGNGEFSTKTATWAAHRLDLVHKPVREYNQLWKLDIIPKLKIFLWQLCHLSLPTKGTLSKRGLNIDPVCPFCILKLNMWIICFRMHYRIRLLDLSSFSQLD